jgi:hypothetical protein
MTAPHFSVSNARARAAFQISAPPFSRRPRTPTANARCVGTGYLVRLTAQDTAHKLTGCAGSASFDIQGATTVPVPVHLICHEVPAAAPTAVPVPRWATFMITALLLSLGALAVRRDRRQVTGGA